MVKIIKQVFPLSKFSWWFTASSCQMLDRRPFGEKILIFILMTFLPITQFFFLAFVSRKPFVVFCVRMKTHKSDWFFWMQSRQAKKLLEHELLGMCGDRTHSFDISFARVCKVSILLKTTFSIAHLKLEAFLRIVELWATA